MILIDYFTQVARQRRAVEKAEVAYELAKFKVAQERAALVRLERAQEQAELDRARKAVRK